MTNGLWRLPRNLPALSPLPLHSGLGTAEQLQVFAPAQPGTRKVIIATNIAEVSQEELFRCFLIWYTDECHHRRNQVRRGLWICEGWFYRVLSSAHAQ